MSGFAIAREPSDWVHILRSLHEALRRGLTAEAVAHLDTIENADGGGEDFSALDHILRECRKELERVDVIAAEIIIDCARFERSEAAMREAYRQAIETKRIAA
jgi:hypothetical protein